MVTEDQVGGLGPGLLGQTLLALRVDLSPGQQPARWVVTGQGQEFTAEHLGQRHPERARVDGQLWRSPQAGSRSRGKEARDRFPPRAFSGSTALRTRTSSLQIGRIDVC